MERLATGYRLIEAPTFDDGALLFSDVFTGGVRRLLADGTVEDVLAHRRGIGGMAVHADGGYVVSGRNVAWKRGDDTVVLLDRQHDGQSFNDLTTDPDGRIYVGSLEIDPFDEGGEPSPGELFLIDLDGSVRVVADDVGLSNGLGVSPDGSRLYHADTGAHAVWVYDRAPDGGLGARRTLYRADDADPDGLAVAEDGTVWVAMASGGEVLVLSPGGEVVDRVEVEVPMVTSVCFGGADRNDLYVVTGDRGAPADVGAAVYRTRVGVIGLTVGPARVRPVSAPGR